MPDYLSFLSYISFILIIFALLIFFTYKKYSPIELYNIINIVEEWSYPKIALLTFSLSSITTAFISSYVLMELIKDHVPKAYHFPSIIYSIIFIVTLVIYFITFKFFNRYYLELCSIKFLNYLNLFLELSGIFFLGLIIFLALGSTSIDNDIDSLSNNFMITIFLLSFIAINHYNTNKIISSKSDTIIKDEMFLSNQELIEEGYKSKFESLEKRLEKIESEQKFIAVKTAMPIGYLDKIIAICRIIKNK